MKVSYVKVGRAIPHSKGHYTHKILVKTVYNNCVIHMSRVQKMKKYIGTLKLLYCINTIHGGLSVFSRATHNKGYKKNGVRACLYYAKQVRTINYL